MDSESRAFEVSHDGGLLTQAGTPLPCLRRMVPQSLAPVSPGRLLLNLVAALLPAPTQRMPILIKRHRD